jgi:CHAD domain-containing protein
VRRFARAVPRVLDRDDPKAVHRARVAARRLEEYLAAISPGSKPKKLKKMRRLLKHVRRDLGGWRNCDVVLAMIDKNRRATDKEARQSAWNLVERHVKKERGREMKRARRSIDVAGVDALDEKLEAWLDAEAPNAETVQAGLDLAAERWRSALEAAEKSCSGRELHEFRVATKKFRYRLELAGELGGAAPPLLPTLKRLQRALGKWHDREIADRMIAESLARPKFLLREFRAAQRLLKELEKDDRRQNAAVAEILRAARAAAAPAESSEGPSLLLAFSRP